MIHPRKLSVLMVCKASKNSSKNGYWSQFFYHTLKVSKLLFTFLKRFSIFFKKKKVSFFNRAMNESLQIAYECIDLSF